MFGGPSRRQTLTPVPTQRRVDREERGEDRFARAPAARDPDALLVSIGSAFARRGIHYERMVRFAGTDDPDVLTWRSATVRDRPRIGAQLRALPFLERSQGDAEVRVVFHVAHLSAVLAILKPYRRRQVSEAERERLTAIGSAALARHRAAGNCGNAETASESTQPREDGKSGTAA